jgi:hypothetical protein
MTTNINVELIEAINQKKGLKHVQALVAQAADINYAHVVESGYMPQAVINLAAKSGDLETVKWLKSQGAKPFTHEFFSNHEFYTEREKIFGEEVKKMGMTLIDSACHSGNIELVNWLLDNGTDISEIDLAEAASSHSLPLVKWLVEEKGVRINDQCIMEAIPNREMVDWFLDQGAPLMQDGMDLSTAVYAGNLEIAQLLYEKGARSAKVL